ncbi:MAG: lipoate protein ligase C-terminal domain-containing protein [Candidatus Nanoarchaeia archaeon]|nr:lipoate protein ligase C-terminal domain-containing protein [Candidatus Nanoarchaeia archaeon]
MPESCHKVCGGKLVKIRVEFNNNKISKIKITGDFFLHPEETLILIETNLIGKELSECEETINETLKNNNAIMYGIDSVSVSEMIKVAFNEVAFD